ncbi:hypothetical protein JB92DRAFT_64234 [Gautieria morchelliformis]|nr:hypothetical protein JB92DRAFT_64234 [Gautieria morchelliformis]
MATRLSRFEALPILFAPFCEKAPRRQSSPKLTVVTHSSGPHAQASALTATCKTARRARTRWLSGRIMHHLERRLAVRGYGVATECIPTLQA